MVTLTSNPQPSHAEVFDYPSSKLLSTLPCCIPYPNGAITEPHQTLSSSPIFAMEPPVAPWRSGGLHHHQRQVWVVAGFPEEMAVWYPNDYIGEPAACCKSSTLGNLLSGGPTHGPCPGKEVPVHTVMLFRRYSDFGRSPPTFQNHPAQSALDGGFGQRVMQNPHGTQNFQFESPETGLYILTGCRSLPSAKQQSQTKQVNSDRSGKSHQPLPFVTLFIKLLGKGSLRTEKKGQATDNQY